MLICIPMSESIQWTSQNVDLPNLDYRKLEDWIKEVSATLGYKTGALTYIFCDDEKILEVNRQFLQHDYYTDIITFDYSRRAIISGDMFISLDTVRTNAELVGSDYLTELHRVIIHGVLHLCGINDKGPGEREIMEAHENRALTMLK
jgi:probable rRNA maturation factor